MEPTHKNMGQIDKSEQIHKRSSEQKHSREPRMEWVEITSPWEKTSNRRLIIWAGVIDWTALSSPKG